MSLEDLTCFMHREPDISRNRQIRWALPLHMRCNCTKVLPRPDIMGSCDLMRHSKVKYWFTDEQRLLVQPNVWRSGEGELLQYYLDCPYEGMFFVLFLGKYFIKMIVILAFDQQRCAF